MQRHSGWCRATQCAMMTLTSTSPAMSPQVMDRLGISPTELRPCRVEPAGLRRVRCNMLCPEMHGTVQHSIASHAVCSAAPSLGSLSGLVWQQQCGVLSRPVTRVFSRALIYPIACGNLAAQLAAVLLLDSCTCHVAVPRHALSCHTCGI